MKNLSLIILVMTLVLVACKKEDKSDYAGTWNFKSSEGQFDTTFAISISNSGDFTFQLMISTTQATLMGSVNDKGSLTGKINTSGITVGSMNGTLNTSGTGSGNYYILSDTVAWTASKK